MAEALKTNYSELLEDFDQAAIDEALTIIWEGDLNYETFQALELALPINLISTQSINVYCKARGFSIIDRNELYGKVNPIKVQAASAGLLEHERTRMNLVRATGLSPSTIRQYCEENNIELFSTYIARKMATDSKIKQALDALLPEERTMNNIIEATGLGETRIRLYCKNKRIRLLRSKRVKKARRQPAEPDPDSLDHLPGKYQAAILKVWESKPNFKFDLSLVSLDILEAIENLLLDVSPFEIRHHLREIYNLTSYEISQYVLICGLDISNQASMVKIHNDQIIGKAIQAIPAADRTLYNMAKNLIGFSQARIETYCQEHGIEIISEADFKQRQRLESDQIIHRALLQTPRPALVLPVLVKETKRSVDEVKDFLERHNLYLVDLRQNKAPLEAISFDLY